MYKKDLTQNPQQTKGATINKEYILRKTFEGYLDLISSLAFNAINTEILVLNDLENKIRLEILDYTA